MFLPPIRKILPKLLYEPGSGAEESTIKNNWFGYWGVAETDTSVQPKSRALDQMCYNGDLYIFTTIALGEAAQIVLWQWGSDASHPREPLCVSIANCWGCD